MKLVCKWDELLKALSAVNGAINPGAYLPILKGCLLIAKDSFLTVIATNLEQTIKISISAEIKEEGQVVTVHRTFLDLTRKMNASEVILETKDNLLHIKCGKLQSKLHTWNATDFPKTEPVEENTKFFHFPAQKWKRFIEKVIIATSPARIQIYGVLVDILEQEIRFAATDGYRLAVLKAKNDTEVTEGRMFIPAQALIGANKLVGDMMDYLEITFNEDFVCFACSSFTLQSRLLGSEFLNYEQVFPKNVTAELRMNKDSLFQTLQRASLFINKDAKYAMARIYAEGDTVIISAHAAEIGSIREEIALAELVSEQEIHFNVKYLLDPLHVMESEEAIFRLHGECSPGVYCENGDNWGYLHLVSPLCKM
ncbi:MAG TPA: DNA polymerase III subunit beta [Fervidobacterium sp.]|jgi:DNA polymerase-3 subunit beta|nr:DNA polymerase III subunit beta [Fervidobacterium sp.]